MSVNPKSITIRSDSENSERNFASLEASGQKNGNLSPAASRALKEAEQRRKQPDNKSELSAKEVNGRGGLDPVRFNDWEIKGIAVDF